MLPSQKVNCQSTWRQCWALVRVSLSSPPSLHLAPPLPLVAWCPPWGYWEGRGSTPSTRWSFSKAIRRNACCVSGERRALKAGEVVCNERPLCTHTVACSSTGCHVHTHLSTECDVGSVLGSEGGSSIRLSFLTGVQQAITTWRG